MHYAYIQNQGHCAQEAQSRFSHVLFRYVRHNRIVPVEGSTDRTEQEKECEVCADLYPFRFLKGRCH